MSATCVRCAVAGFALIGLGNTPARAITIHFDELAAFTTVSNQYPSVTFSSEAGEELRVLAFGAGAPSPMNAICTAAVGGEFDCARDVYLDFASPVNNLTFWAVEPNGSGILATFFVYNGATLLGTQDLIGLGTGSSFGAGNKFVDLTSFSNITRLEIRGPGGSGTIDFDNGGNGVAWDSFNFEPVPGPSGAVVLAMAIISGRGRRCARQRSNR